MFEIVRYTPERQAEWNQFVAQSKNGTFLFDRRYMDYHSDRFHDFSLMFYREGRLFGLLPANRVDDILQSHMGLTYGGLVMDARTTAAATLELFRQMNSYLREQGVRKVLYKCIPWMYHQMAAEEDLYAISQTCDARLAARDLGIVIVQRNAPRWERIRRRAVKRAMEAGIVVDRSNDLAGFWQVLSDNLATKYGSKPVHTLEEMKLLQARFPQNIILYTACRDGQMLGGMVVYVSTQVARAQYSSATPLGKELGALDAIYDRIIHHDFRELPYFEFGTSALSGGHAINETLVFQKEGFGGRGICFDTYEWTL